MILMIWELLISTSELKFLELVFITEASQFAEFFCICSTLLEHRAEISMVDIVSNTENIGLPRKIIIRLDRF